MKFSTKAFVIILAVSFASASDATAIDYDYGAYYVPRGGFSKIVKYSTPRVLVTTMTLRMPDERLTFKESPKERKLMYLEKTPLAEVNLEPYFNSRESPAYPYNPEEIVMILHICDQEGKDLQTVPIERKYSFPMRRGAFRGEQIVVLWAFNRGGWGNRLCVFLNTGMKIIISNSPSDYVSETASPDGEHLVISWNHRILYDGIQVLPFYDPEPFFHSDPPDSPKYFALKAWEEARARALETDDKPDVSWFHVVGEKRTLVWLEGGKKFALIDHPPAALLFHEKKKEFTSEILERSRSPELVIVNVEKIPTGDINQYAQFIPLQIDYTKLGKDVQSGELPWPVYDEKENAIKLQANCVGPTGRTRLQTMAAIPVP